MTTSSDYVLTISRDDIIKMALEDCWAYAPDFQQPASGQISRASVRLNAMIKAWQAAGVGLWLNAFVAIPTVAATQSYSLGPGGAKYGTDFGTTTVAVAAAAGTSSITVVDVSATAGHINDDDQIGILLSTGAMQWTVVNGAPVGEVVSLDAVLAASVLAGAVVYTYNQKTYRPIGIAEARRRDVGGSDTPLYVGSRDEYAALPLKSSVGPTTQVYFDPQTVNSMLYAWPVTSIVTDVILMTMRVPIQVFDALTDTPDFPEEWTDALHFNLAIRLPVARKMPTNEYERLKEMAAIALRDANDFDREQTPVYLVPNFGPGRA